MPNCETSKPSEACPKGGFRHLWYSETAHPSRVQSVDWCVKCGIQLIYGLSLSRRPDEN